MNGYNFTERVRRVLAMAREEAVRLRHEYVGTEHILLALLAEGEGVAAVVLQNFGLPLTEMRDLINDTVKKGSPDSPIGPDLPYTSRAKKVLELAMDEARLLGHNYVGTEHMLIGLIREEKGIAAQVIVHSGLTLEPARREVLRLLGTDDPSRMPASAESSISSVSIEIYGIDGRIERMRFQTAGAAIEWLQLKR